MRRFIPFWMTGCRRSSSFRRVYGRWMAQLQVQHGIVEHLIWVSLGWVAAVVLLGMLVWSGAMGAAGPRRHEQDREWTSEACIHYGRLPGWEFNW